MSDQEPKKLKRLSPHQEETSNAIKVLYVEDAEVIRDTLSRLLELNGFKVNYAKNGKEGIETAIRWKPDVILMDLRMPVMDGYKAITELKMDARTKKIPVFVVSAWSSNTERTQAKLAGAIGFFVKPPDLNKLIAAIQEVVGGK
jgi:two-component system, cell cycle response regulator DivK